MSSSQLYLRDLCKIDEQPKEFKKTVENEILKHRNTFNLLFELNTNKKLNLGTDLIF